MSHKITAPTIREILKIYGIKATKSLSQNFITKKSITDTIVHKIERGSLKQSFFVEVGPGPGLLTRSLLDGGASKVVAIEKDARFLPALKQLSDASKGRLVVLHGDILTVSHEEIIKEMIPNVHIKSHFVGNLPFNISTVLIMNWLRKLHERSGFFTLPNIEMTLLFQKEVGDSICAKQHRHARSRLSVMSQALCHVNEVMDLPSQAFVPAPKVSASLVKFIPRNDGLMDGIPYELFEKIVKFSFSAKNKLLINSLGAHMIDAPFVFSQVGIPPSFKAISLNVEMYRDLTKYIMKNNVQIYTKDEMKALKLKNIESQKIDEKGDVDLDESARNRLQNRRQRQMSAQRKLERKQAKLSSL